MYENLSDTAFMKMADALWDVATRENPFWLPDKADRDRYDALLKYRNKYCIYDEGEWWPVNQQRTTIQDKDVLLHNGVYSPADGKTYSNRRAWNEHLRARNLVEVGNDFNKAHEKPRELKGNFNCREALTMATREVLTKQKYK